MTAAPPPAVTNDGVAGIARGATAAAVSKAWKTELSLVGSPGSGCTIAAIRLGKATGYALFRRGRLAAVYFQNGGRTDRGVRVGTSERVLVRAYPGAAKRGEAWFYGNLRFDVAGGTVSRIGYGDVRTTSCG